MSEQIETILNRHCEMLKNIDRTQNISKIIRSIDSLTQSTYEEIYALRDGRKNGTYEAMAKKHGHCC
jgi:t-SNARE complex subunit (syntaxin)